MVGNCQPLQQQLIELFHSSAQGGHSGVQATTKPLKVVLVWKGLQKHVQEFVQACSTCQQNKYDPAATPRLLQPLPIPDYAFKEISMDFIEGLPSSEGKKVILVIVDRLTKYANFIGLGHPYMAPVVAQRFLDQVLKPHGLPALILSDQDPSSLVIFGRNCSAYKVSHCGSPPHTIPKRMARQRSSTSAWSATCDVCVGSNYSSGSNRYPSRSGGII